MKKAFSWLLGTMLLSGIYSCSDNTIGTSIADTKLEIVADSSFTVSGASVRNEKILTRTMTQLLGAIKATNYGELESEATIKTMDELEQESGYIEFTYIFAEDKRWKFFHAGQSCEGLKDLKDTLDQMGIDYLPEEQTEEVAFEQTM